MSDALSAAIEAAVERAVAAQMSKIVKAVKDAANAEKPDDRFVRLDEVARMLGINRSTIFRHEKAGRFPKRRKIGRATGYLLSEVVEIQKGMQS